MTNVTPCAGQHVFPVPCVAWARLAMSARALQPRDDSRRGGAVTLTTCFPSRRWLEDESDEDDAAGGAGGGGVPEGQGEPEGGGRDPPGPGEREDPPGTADDPRPPSTAPGGQGAPEDTTAAATAAARALSGRAPGGGSVPSAGRAPSPPAAGRSPAASTLARHSLPRGTHRHPRPPHLAAARRLPSRPRHARDAHAAECRASDRVPPCEEAQFEYEEERSYEEIFEDSEEERESPDRAASVARACHDKALVPVTARHASQADGASDSALDRDGEAMVARTPPATQAGKALAPCPPDQLQALSALTLQVKEAAADPSGALRQPAPATGAKEAAQPAPEGDAPACSPTTPSEGEGERQEERHEEGPPEDAADEPDFPTPQWCTGKPRVLRVGALGSLGQGRLSREGSEGDLASRLPIPAW